MVNCYSHVFSLMHPHHLFGSNSVYTYPTFLNHVFLHLTTGLHAWIYFCLHFPNFTSISFRLPLPFALRFHFVFFYGITEFVLYLYVWGFQPVNPGKDPTFLFICSLASINLTSTSSLKIFLSKIWAIKYLALQQVVISAHFIPASHNDLLISESSDRAILVYLEFGTILITTTSCWYFPCPYRYLPFLFQDYQQIVNTAFLKAKM